MGRKEPLAGESLSLAIDLDLQQKAYDVMEGQKGAVVISNPANGEILALVSRPSFNPNIFSGVQKKHLAAVEAVLQDPDEPLFNRALSGVYPPGSVFKIVTAAAGLESGKINRQTLIEDTVLQAKSRPLQE